MNVDKSIKYLINLDKQFYEYSDKSLNKIDLVDIINKWHSGLFDFSSFSVLKIKKNSKQRKVACYKENSVEDILSQSISIYLKSIFKLDFPNRNLYITSLDGTFSLMKNLNNFCILKFDFNNFYNSVSSKIIFKKFILSRIDDREYLNLISDYVCKTKKCYAGLRASNIICEIAGKVFDERLENSFLKDGMIFYRRYIDDCIIVFNKNVPKDYCLDKINNLINDVFNNNDIGIKGIVKLNDDKTTYFQKKDLSNGKNEVINFLGYKFIFSLDENNKLSILYGLSDNKIEKYKNKVAKIIDDYKSSFSHDESAVELLRLRILAFIKRTVYIKENKGKKFWISKGFIQNYSLLGLKFQYIEKDTKDFLTSYVGGELRKLDPMPYFVKNLGGLYAYNLKYNLIKNKVLLFFEGIGIGMEKLKEICYKININVEKKTYDELMRECLIKLYVGY